MIYNSEAVMLPKRSLVSYFVVFFNVLLTISALLAAYLIVYVYSKASDINRVGLDESLTQVSEPAGERVINILLVGSDSSANLEASDPIRRGRSGERLGDVIIVAHLDERTGQAALLSLPRDLWVPIPGTGRKDRINQAFESGGPALLIETIEENFDIPIHHYANVDFAGFQGLVSAVDNVEVCFDAPARDWNAAADPPRSQTGFYIDSAGCHDLDPDQSLAYVRSRYYQTLSPNGNWVTDPTSDLGRIKRQQGFVRLLLQKSLKAGARNPLVLNDLIATGLENVTIDSQLTPQHVLDIASVFQDFEPDSLQTYSLPSSDAKVGTNLVLLPKEESSEPILELFRGEYFDSPKTVGAQLIVSEKNAATTTALVDELEAEGFKVDIEVDAEQANTVSDLTVLHSKDGKEAGKILVSKLENSDLKQSNNVVGRDVQILVPSGL